MMISEKYPNEVSFVSTERAGTKSVQVGRNLGVLAKASRPRIKLPISGFGQTNSSIVAKHGSGATNNVYVVQIAGLSSERPFQFQIPISQKKKVDPQVAFLKDWLALPKTEEADKELEETLQGLANSPLAFEDPS